MTVSAPIEIPPKDAAPVNALERRYRVWRYTPEGREVYRLFLVFAVQRLRTRRRFGVKALAERVRWELDTLHERAPHELKINNSHVAYIARELIRDVPALKELIEFRRVKDDPCEARE